MKTDLSVPAVHARLQRLRALYRPLNAEQAIGRTDTAPRDETFVNGVSRRLEELRALCELTTRLHASTLAGARRHGP